MAYIYNIFELFASDDVVIEQIFKLIETHIERIETRANTIDDYHDKLSNLIFLKGICCKHLKMTSKAVICFNQVLEW